MANSPSNARRIALNGLLLAMAAVLMYLAAVIPGLKLTLFAVSSFLIAIIIIEFGAKNAWVFYAASVLLIFIIIPNKLMMVPYAAFFGLYGILKHYIEKIGRRIRNKANLLIEYALKLLCFSAFIIPLTLLATELLFTGRLKDYPIWALIVLSEVAFIVYDYLYTIFIGIYTRSIRRKING